MKLFFKKKEEINVEEQENKKQNIRWMGRFLKRHKGITCVIVFVLIGSMVGCVIYQKQQNSPKSSSTGNLGYETMVLTKRDISTSISVTGTVAAATTKTISTTLNNIDVKTVNVAVGDEVTVGDTLLEFDDTDLSESLSDAKESLSVSQQQSSNNVKNAQRQYSEAVENANVQATRAQENVNSAYNSYTNAVSTESSSKTAYQEAVTAREEAESAAAQAKEKLTKLETQLSNLQTQLQNATTDTKKASIQEKIDAKQAEITTAKSDSETKSAALETAQKTETEAKQTYEQAATALEQASSSYTKAVQDQEDTTRNNNSTLAQQESSVESAKLQSVTSTNNDESQVKTLQEQVDSCVVTATMSGIVTALNVEEGETFAGGEVLTIQDNSNLMIEAAVDEYDIADVEKGMSVVVKTDATGEEELEGEITYVAPTPESSEGSAMGNATSSSSASYKIQIALKSQNDRLRIGMSAKASILTASATDVFAVPYDAIETNADGESVIYVVDNSSMKKSRRNEETTNGTDDTQTAESKDSVGTDRTDIKEEGVDTTTEENSDESMPQGERPDFAEGERPNGRPEGAPNGTSSGESGSDTGMQKKEIVVEVGLESDYYTEISGDGLEEGMLVITGTSTTASGDKNTSDSKSTSLFNIGGSGMSGGSGRNSSGGGMPAGGGPH